MVEPRPVTVCSLIRTCSGLVVEPMYTSQVVSQAVNTVLYEAPGSLSHGTCRPLAPRWLLLPRSHSFQDRVRPSVDPYPALGALPQVGQDDVVRSAPRVSGVALPPSVRRVESPQIPSGVAVGAQPPVEGRQVGFNVLAAPHGDPLALVPDGCRFLAPRQRLPTCQRTKSGP